MNTKQVQAAGRRFSDLIHRATSEVRQSLSLGLKSIATGQPGELIPVRASVRRPRPATTPHRNRF